MMSGIAGRRGNRLSKRMKFPLFAVVFVVSVRLFAVEPRLIAPDEKKHLVLDSRVIVSASNARLAPGTLVKEARNPLLHADQPWENALNNLYPNVLWDAEERVFKLWYKCVLADKDVIAKMDVPSTVHDVGWHLLYATSKDGVAWERPALDLHKFDGRGGNNSVRKSTPVIICFACDAHSIWAGESSAPHCGAPFLRGTKVSETVTKCVAARGWVR